MGPSYQYKAIVRRWVDADTVDLDIDLGFTVHIHARVRLNNIDAAERFTTLGKAAIVWVNEYYPVGSEVVAVTYKDGADKYGRWLADIYYKDATVSANDLLVAEGFAVYKEY